MGRQTRKQKSKTLSIPQLRKSFDHIDMWVDSHLRHHKKGMKDLVPAFQAEWKKTFHRDVNAKAAEAYLSLKHKTAPKTTRKQHGGAAALAGAPLDYTTRQGVYGVYGNFPQYVSSGLTFYDQINQDSLTAGCGTENITPKLPADMGSNLVHKGGKSRRLRGRKGRKGRKTRRHHRQRGGYSASQSLAANAMSATRATLDVIANRPFPASQPPSTAFITQMDLKGQNVATPHPSVAPYQPQPYDPAGYKNAPTLINRNLVTELRPSMF